MSNITKKPKNFNELLNPDGVYTPEIYPPPLGWTANPFIAEKADLENDCAQHVVLAHDDDGKGYWTGSNCRKCGGEFYTYISGDDPGLPGNQRCEECR
tara:strand:- start:377 stop:670 length:294 start_codon:yes stop_codon:yes gene_type:complete